jgi:putative endonuclease
VYAGELDPTQVSPAGLTRGSIFFAKGWIAELGPAIHHSSVRCWVYILTSRAGGTLYVGVTNDLIRRIFEHRKGLVEGFTKRHNLKMLVYFEQHDTALAAIQREKNVKHWPREWKIDLIRSTNPEWRDLYDDIIR